MFYFQTLKHSKYISFKNPINTRKFGTFLPQKRLRRVLFNVPGSDLRKIKKAVTLNLDCIVLDLEDGVAQNQKEVARKTIVDSFKTETFPSRSERLIRINSIGSGLENEDLKGCAQKLVEQNLLDGIVVPKVENPDHLLFVSKFLDRLGDSKVKLLAAIESAKAIVELRDICRAGGTRLEGLIFASEDFCADMGATRTAEARELLYARSAVVLHAVAFGVQSIDMVCLDYKNPEILFKETLEGKQMGYTGKQAIHPNQIDPIYKAFYPSDSELKLAKDIIEGNQLHQAAGKGAFSLNGKMIDMPMVKWAHLIIQRSQDIDKK